MRRKPKLATMLDAATANRPLRVKRGIETRRLKEEF
jgi:hypothetical protein